MAWADRWAPPTESLLLNIVLGDEPQLSSFKKGNQYSIVKEQRRGEEHPTLTYLSAP
jgi:hypothetical protein